jgi:hypothetical protein
VSAPAELVAEARAVYADDPVACRTLDDLDARLREPVRIAIAGMVKAGKSTLLNALIGEQIAPTDAGECTRAVIWYRYAPSARIVAFLRGGGMRRLPVVRRAGRIEFDLGTLAADDIERIEVGWPADALRSYVLIDTPGIGSLSTETSAVSTRFLTAADAPSEADAVIYLLRHVNAVDLAFLDALRGLDADGSATVNAIAVLSRSDEIGSGRIDALISASRVAERYRRDGVLRGLALDVVPVAGLLAESARTLREDEFATFRALAGLDRTVRQRLLISADRFTQPHPAPVPPVAARRALMDRFGVFGVRWGTALVAAGASSSSILASRMIAQSGLQELEKGMADQFRARATALKFRWVVRGVEGLVQDRPRPGANALRRGLERAGANDHDLRELQLLARLRTQDAPLAQDERLEAARVIGGDGVSRTRRLGLAEGATDAQLQVRAAEIAGRWRGRAEFPLAAQDATAVCQLVARSAERVVVSPGR